MHYSLAQALPTKSNIIEILPLNDGSVRSGGPDRKIEKKHHIHVVNNKKTDKQIETVSSIKPTNSENHSIRSVPMDLGTAYRRTRQAQTALRISASIYRDEESIEMARNILNNEQKSLKMALRLKNRKIQRTINLNKKRQIKSMILNPKPLFTKVNNLNDFTYTKSDMDIFEEINNFYLQLEVNELIDEICSVRITIDKLADEVNKLKEQIECHEKQLPRITKIAYSDMNIWFKYNLIKQNTEIKLQDAQRKLWEAQVYSDSLEKQLLNINQ